MSDYTTKDKFDSITLNGPTSERQFTLLERVRRAWWRFRDKSETVHEWNIKLSADSITGELTYTNKLPDFFNDGRFPPIKYGGGSVTVVFGKSDNE
jgi:hypothetical protein